MTQPTTTVSKMVDKFDNPQIGDRLAACTAVTESHSSGSAADLDLLAVTINQLVARLEAHGLIADN